MGADNEVLTQTDGSQVSGPTVSHVMPQAVEVTPAHKLGERKSPFVVAAQAKKNLWSGGPPKWWDALKERCVATLCGQGELPLWSFLQSSSSFAVKEHGEKEGAWFFFVGLRCVRL